MSKFSDPADEATYVEELFTQRSIEAVLAKGDRPQLAFTGKCHNCGDSLEKPHRFCDAECIEEWEYVEKRKHANRHA